MILWMNEYLITEKVINLMIMLLKRDFFFEENIAADACHLCNLIKFAKITNNKIRLEREENKANEMCLMNIEH